MMMIMMVMIMMLVIMMMMVSGYFWICGLDYSKANSKVRFRDLSGLSPLVNDDDDYDDDDDDDDLDG